MNYLLNIDIFYGILPVNNATVLYSDHKVIFWFNLGHVMFPDTDGHEASV